MPTLVCPISQSLQEALENNPKRRRAHLSPRQQCVVPLYGVKLHTLFQVSTSGALVQGVYQKAVSSQLLSKRGMLAVLTIL
jgi:acetolactate decarboxylase